jgi:N,N'-diacetyllegionaminate synthase
VNISKRVTIIAEAGVNHNGDLLMAKELANIAAESGADYVKYQTFIPELVASTHAPKAKYQKNNKAKDESQLDLIRKLQLTFDEFEELKSHCDQINIKFLSTAFDMKSLAFLRDLKMEIVKIPSGEITNLPYLREIGSFGLPVILSTGMADLDEVDQALKVLSDAGTPRSQVTVLHCTTQYPTLFNEVNLTAMVQMRSELGVDIGYSDHTLGTDVAIAAVALGARVIEKHFTLDRHLDGPDHAASVEPDELAQLVQSIRNIEQALGNGIKAPTEDEMTMRTVARRSLVAARPIAEGELFTEENVLIKRPGDGISPMQINDVLHKPAPRAFDADEKIEL